MNSYKIIQIIPMPEVKNIEFYIDDKHQDGHSLCIALIEDSEGNRSIVPAALRYKKLGNTTLPYIEPITEEWR